MIILDTNIISEMMKPSPSLELINWLNQQVVIQLFITTITIAEISYGLNVLPAGKRRSLLEEAFNKAIKDGFEHRILNFDEKASHLYGHIMGLRKGLGQPLSVLDGQIAAIGLANEATLVTRNVKDFKDCGIAVINPFNSSK